MWGKRGGMWGHKGKGKKFGGRRGQRFYTKIKNKEQEGWYVRRGVVVLGGVVLVCVVVH